MSIPPRECNLREPVIRKRLKALHAYEIAFGIAIGLATTTPLLGQALPISGQTLSLMAISAAVLIFFFCEHNFRLDSNYLIAIGLLVVYVALVARSAFPEQWGFLVHLSDWRNHTDHYVTAKLTVFFIKTLPPIAFGVMFSVLRNRERAAKSMLLSAIATSLAGYAILLASSGSLIRTPHLVAAAWYNGTARPQFSTISMGLILIIGATAALAWLNEHPVRNFFISVFVGLCLLGTIMLDRRIDTIVFAISIVTILIATYRRNPTSRQVLTSSATIFLVPLLIWPIVTNDYNVEYWQTAPSGFRYRIDAFQNVVEYSSTPTYPTAGATGELETLQKSAQTSQADTSEAFRLLWGGGLGLYAIRSDGGLLYPHNIVLETFLEVGSVAAVALLLAMAILLLPLARKLFTRAITPEELVTAAIATILFLISLKSGDISNVGNILFFMIVAGAIAPLPFNHRARQSRRRGALPISSLPESQMSHRNQG